jgi:hypothetical protein
MKTYIASYRLNSGLEVCLDSLRIDHTYSSLLIGKIDRRANEFSLNLHKILLMQSWSGLPASILNLEALQTEMDGVFPAFHCLGIFSSYHKEDSVTGDLPARFCVVWFQDQFPPIISSENERHLLALDFETVMRAERGPKPKLVETKKKRFGGLF